MAEPIRIERHGSLLRVTLDDPERRNAQLPSTWRALADIGRALDPGIRVVLLDAEGPSFSAGLDRRLLSGEPVDGEPTPLGPLPAWRADEALPEGKTHAMQRLPVAGPLQQMAPLTLAADTYFLMGDNRDNSADSRAFGPVPRRLLVGRVSRLLVSLDTQALAPRWERIGQPLR